MLMRYIVTLHTHYRGNTPSIFDLLSGVVGEARVCGCGTMRLSKSLMFWDDILLPFGTKEIRCRGSSVAELSFRVKMSASLFSEAVEVTAFVTFVRGSETDEDKFWIRGFLWRLRLWEVSSWSNGRFLVTATGLTSSTWTKFEQWTIAYNLVWTYRSEWFVNDYFWFFEHTCKNDLVLEHARIETCAPSRV